MTREEAIRILDPETSAEALAEIEYYVGFRGEEAVKKAVDDACILAVAALREQEDRRWIPVAERLPEEGVPVLIYCWHDETLEESWLQDGSWGGRFNFHYMSEVSHWMPMPEPPKEDV